MIQGGDPNTKSPDRDTHGYGGPGYSIKAEFNDIKHERGILSMARGGDPDSAGSQFFIIVKEYPSLNGDYTVFGRVTRGIEVADKIVDHIIAENVKQGVPAEMARMGRLKFTNPLEPISMKISIRLKK